MTPEQLRGRRLRLARELVEMRGLRPQPADRISRLSREITETDRALTALALVPERQPGFSQLFGGSR